MLRQSSRVAGVLQVPGPFSDPNYLWVSHLLPSVQGLWQRKEYLLLPPLPILLSLFLLWLCQNFVLSDKSWHPVLTESPTP